MQGWHAITLHFCTHGRHDQLIEESSTQHSDKGSGGRHGQLIVESSTQYSGKGSGCRHDQLIEESSTQYLGKGSLGLLGVWSTLLSETDAQLCHEAHQGLTILSVLWALLATTLGKS